MSWMIAELVIIDSMSNLDLELSLGNAPDDTFAGAGYQIWSYYKENA